MRKLVLGLAFVLACSGAAMAAAGAQAKPAKAATKPMASHSTSGVVKSVDSSTLVITKGNKDLTFATNASTQKEGTIAAGSHVTVRYQNDGKSMVATAITEQPVKQMAKSATKSKK